MGQASPVAKNVTLNPENPSEQVRPMQASPPKVGISASTIKRQNRLANRVCCAGIGNLHRVCQIRARLASP